MYWPGHQRPAWHQQPASSAQPVSSMGHYAHPGSMLSNPMTPGMPGDPSLLIQSSIPGRPTHQSTLSHHPNPLAPPGSAQSNIYSNMAGPGGPSSSRQPAQLTPNSHLNPASNQGLPPHSSIQQPPHPQSHYTHQYSSYWNHPPMNSQSSLGPTNGPGSGSNLAPSSSNPQQTENSNSYNSANASPMSMSGDNRGGLPNSSSHQQSASQFHGPKDISSDHVLSYERQRSSLAQPQNPQHQASMMSQNVASNSGAGANIPPTQNMQGRLQTQSAMDSIRSMPQQAMAAPGWSNSSYYGQSTQPPYMNPYMSYGNPGSVSSNSVMQTPTRPSIGQKPPTNGGSRGPAPAYPPHGTSIYGQPPPPGGSTNGTYYGYDSYYNQAPSDLYLPHSTPAGASQHWPNPASTNSMMSNTPATNQIQAPLRPPAGSSGSTLHPQSPSASSMPTISTRTPGPPQTPERSPAPNTSYQSSNQPTSKTSSNSLAQLEQMVMPGGPPSSTSVVKSPTQQSSTSPTDSNLQQQMQYSYNSSGQGSYFTSSTNSGSNQSNYYPQYDSTGTDVQKQSWNEQSSHLTSVGSSGSHMIESSQAPYSQSGYDGPGSYGEFTQLSTPSSSSGQPRFTGSNEGLDTQQSDKDPYAIDSQTFDDFEDQSTTSKTKKTRAKKGEDKVKRERKPRAPRTPKTSLPTSIPSISPLESSQIQGPPVPPPAIDSNISSQQTSFQSPVKQNTLKPQLESIETTESPVLPNNQSSALSPPQRLSTESPSGITQHQVQYPYPSGGQSNFYGDAPNGGQSQSSYYHSYDSTSDTPKQWAEKTDNAGNVQSASTLPPESNPSSVSNLENSSYQTEYTSLSAPVTSNISEKLSSASNNSSGHAKNEMSDTSLPVPQPTESQLETGSSKSKKARTKKSDDKPKKEKKPPRTPRASASTPVSSSPVCNTPVPSNQTELSSKSNFSNLQSTTDKPVLDSEKISPRNSPQSNSDRQIDGVGFYGAPMNHDYSPNSAKPGYFPHYDPSIIDPPTRVPWVEQTSQPGIANASASKSESSFEQVTAESYPEYAPLSSVTKEQETPRTDEIDEPQNASEDLESLTQSKNDQKTTPKVKKTRVRKSDDKVKKQRKPRSAKPPADAEQTEAKSSSPKEGDTVIETAVSQPSQESTVETPKPKRIRVRDSSSKGKKKLPKFALKFAKTKKRKRLGSSDNEQSDLDKTPPPSPDEVESGVQKRRSARNTKKLKYNDDIELGFSDSDDETPTKARKSTGAVADGDGVNLDDSAPVDEPTVFAAPVEDTMVVEKIMSSRMGKRELEPEPGETLPLDGTFIDVEEYYVKYKNLSYLHCDWRTLEELERGDRRVAQKIKRYKQKKDSSNVFSFMDEEPFDPQYCEVDRILAVNEVEELIPDEVDSDKKTSVDSNQDCPTQETCTAESEPQLTANPSEDNSKPSDLISNDNIENKTEIKNETDAPQEQPENPKNSTETETEVKVEVEEPPTSTPDKGVQDTKTDEPVERKMKKKISRHYLVKWRGLSYEESTWELEDDLDPNKIKQFERFKDPPPKSKWKPVKRPKPDEWVRKESSPTYKNNNTLREYQLEGINWLSFCWHQGRNCILADEMGLGKTIQSIAFVNEIYQHGINGPFLIIVPLSTVGNWAREFETWTDLNVITYHGSSTSREMLKEYEMYYRNENGNRITSCYKFQVMITTFEIILSDCLELREIPWRCCIIDEAHRLKNRNCKLLEGLRLLNMEHRVLLTGTPLQNNVEELFSLLNFLEPTQFSSTDQFLQEFGDLKTEAQVDKLKLILKPMMLRRLKEDVEKTLAPKEETIVEVELTNIQKKYYRAILEKNFSFLSKGSSSNNMPNLMNTMMELRKCCIHPYLINGAEEQILYEAKQAKLSGGEIMSSHQAMINSSGKLVLIDKLLPRLRADGHRVLIFSQMVRCLDILEDYVTHKHYPYERIDGRVRGSDRQQAIDRFSKPGSDRFVFLLCTRAGGLGINLTAADTVIIFDSDWNPQNDLQAQARCHRIGQSKAVKIYRLICRNTYEREMFDKASLKLGLDKAVLQSMNTQKTAGGIDGQLTKKEIEELLRKGAYGALMDDDNAGDKFCEEDIDQILSRRTQVITIDNSEAKGSTFSKATFSSSNNREDIELDDPNFWEKWAKKANIESGEMLSGNELIQLAPRRRTQTKRYGADGNLLDMSELESSEEDEETISMRTRGGRVRQSKLTPSSASKRGTKRSRMFDDDEDDEYSANIDGGLWSKSDCLKLEKGLLTFGWGQWDKILASNNFKKNISIEDCETVCRVILLYCLNSYKGDEKIRSFIWELITPVEECSRTSPDQDTEASNRGRKLKSTPIVSKKSISEEISDAKWPKEAKNDPLIALPDDQYRRHLQRNSNR